MSIPAPKWTNPAAEAVLREARKLPKGDRLRIAEALQADDSSWELSPEWKAEVISRAEAFERGELESVDGKEAFARIDAKYARR